MCPSYKTSPSKFIQTNIAVSWKWADQKYMFYCQGSAYNIDNFVVICPWVNTNELRVLNPDLELVISVSARHTHLQTKMESHFKSRLLVNHDTSIPVSSECATQEEAVVWRFQTSAADGFSSKGHLKSPARSLSHGWIERCVFFYWECVSLMALRNWTIKSAKSGKCVPILAQGHAAYRSLSVSLLYRSTPQLGLTDHTESLHLWE